MRMIVVALVAALLTMQAAVAAAPEPLKGPALAAAKARVQLAHDLIAVGRNDRDAQMLFLGARLLFKLGANVADNNLSAVLDEARDLAAGNAELTHEIDALKRAQPAQGVCNWQWLCGANGCGWVQACF